MVTRAMGRPVPPVAKAPAMLAGLLALGLLAAAPASAAMYKCSSGGRVTYSDAPCDGKPDASRFTPKPLTVIESSQFTGRKAPAGNGRPAWLPKAPDPVGDCRAKGGRLDPELRACLID